MAEKGDGSGADGGAAKWRRDNPLAIDWSSASVRLLRDRARVGGSKSPRLQNERLWGRGGCAFNNVASYLRVRRVPAGGVFGHMAPTILPMVEWLTIDALLALLNAPVADFALRTFLGSRMHIEIGDIRRLPVPVLDGSQASALDLLGRRAVAAKEALDAGAEGEPLGEIERELDLYTRELYGVAADADLWVVR